jgi:CheY-like chemotaxis protein
MAMDYSDMRALVVDDYEQIRIRIAAALRELGFETAEAAHGLEALAALREAAFDVVFTDIVMPEMDGFELCQEVRKDPELVNTPIVVASTHHDARYVVQALRLGADDYIPKPVEPRLLRQVVERVLTPTFQEAGHV